MLQIREAQVADAAAIARVHVDAWRTTYQQILPADFLAGLSYAQRESMWQGALIQAEQRPFILVAVDDTDGLVGFVSGGPERSGNLRCDGEIYAIYLLQQYQRRGIGRQLFSQLVQHLQRAGFRAVALWVVAANPARHFYEQMGGQVLATKEETIGDVTIAEVAYGWPDLATFNQNSHPIAAH